MLGLDFEVIVTIFFFGLRIPLYSKNYWNLQRGPSLYELCLSIFTILDLDTEKILKSVLSNLKQQSLLCQYMKKITFLEKVSRVVFEKTVRSAVFVWTFL